MSENALEEPINGTAELAQAGQRIIDELQDRFEAEPSERDWVAVESAIQKALKAGVDNARVMFEIVLLRRNLSVPLHGSLNADFPDLWAERYGDETDTDG